MKQRAGLSAVWTAIFLAASLMGGAVQAKSPSADSGQSTSKAKKKSATGAKGTKTSAGGQMKILPGSAETTKERNDRLKRECKGRVNAGACAGFTG